MPEVVVRRSVGEGEYPRLVEIWRSAVDATHHFLAADDRADIEEHLASDYFPHVNLIVAERDGIAVGFAGTAEQNLEMLFVDAAERGRGTGTALLAYVVDHDDVAKVDVNEQNSKAVEFYLRRGFEVVGRSELDDQGRAYPLLHMRIKRG
ncbi:acetyltransferase [Gordonia phthalatica]|uniref:GCN5 family acetyltransferase n=1 Tax=Gordonia phthalatica TaxID=1136941 RepID=A0A0N9NIR5_9ACTN|nr:acetyltransferase [Gordonia phthalatica]ALG85440.1 GCN5 family acetyltransferase [Gordonia phthalatica]